MSSVIPFGRHSNDNPYRRNIAEGRNSFAYPIGFQAADGRIHIVYTSDQRTVINHAVFGEEWVKGGPPAR